MDKNLPKRGSLPTIECLPPPIPPRIPRPHAYTANNGSTQPPTYDAAVTDGPITTNFGPISQLAVCPHCHYYISTKVENYPNMETHFCALCMFYFGCCLCCLCPYLIDDCQVQNHYCPECNAYLGKCDI